MLQLPQLSQCGIVAVTANVAIASMIINARNINKNK